MHGWRRLTLVLGLAGVSACAGLAAGRIGTETTVQTPTQIEALRTPLGPLGADLDPSVTFAGGLTLRGPDIHGLSDLKIHNEYVWSVSDFGRLVIFRPFVDDAGRLVGVENGTARRLIGPDGLPLTDKASADAEGLVVLDDGTVLIGFEGDHRVETYGPNAGGVPIRVPSPDADFPANEGMEGLARSDPDGWLVLGEAGGAWSCRPSGCQALPAYPEIGADGFRVTGADRDPAGGWFIVERSFTPPLDVRARVRRMAPDGSLGPPLIQLRPPAAVDNFEGIAAVPTLAGSRLYLLSDDNANPLQRTLLLAFDVTPVPRP